MNFESLLYDSSKICVTKAAEEIGPDKKKFGMLVEFALQEKPKFGQRAIRVINRLLEKFPYLAAQYYGKFISALEQTNNDSIKFNLLKIFTITPLPENDRLLGRLMNICFNLMDIPSDKAAIKVYCIDILYQISNVEPGLKNELIILIENHLPYSSVAFRARGRKILIQLFRDTGQKNRDIDLLPGF